MAIRSTEAKRSTARIWVLVLILSLAFALRLFHLSVKEMWYDEAFAVLYAEKDLASIVRGTVTPVEGAAADIHPLLYYFFLHGWMEIGQGPFLIRFPSVVFGLVSICVVYRVAKELFDAQVGQLAAMLAAISPFHIWYSQEARMYSLLCLLSLLSIYLFAKAGKSNEWKHWIGFGLFTGVALYVHNLAFLIVVALDLVVLLRRQWALLRPLIVAHLVGVLLFLPWLLLVPGQFAKVRQAYWIPRPGPTELVRTLIVFNFNLPGPKWALPFTLFFSLLLLALTLYRLLRPAWSKGGRSSWEANLCLSLSFIPTLTMFAISQIKPVYIERALLASALLYCVTVARAMRRSRLPRVVAISLIPIPLLLTTSLWYQYNYAGFPRSPFREANSYLRERYAAGDVIVHDSKLSFFPSHYYDRGLAQEYVGDVPGSPTDTLALPTQEVLGLLGKPDMSTAVGDAEHVWFVVFQRALDEAKELGEPNRNMAWLEDHYRLTDAIEYGDLNILVYERS